MYGSSPLGLSSAVHTVLAYPKTAITVAACCAAFAVFAGGGSRDEVLDDPVCIEGRTSCETPAAEEAPPVLESTPLLFPPAPPGTSCRLVPKVKPPVAHVARPRPKKAHVSGEQPIRKPGVHKHHAKKHHAPAPVEYERVCD